jgi:endonuclease/exonuclease/phosphatase family metal-dependent hydrolase
VGHPATEHLRIATLNIFAHHDPWRRRREILTDGLRRLDVDVIALQEVITRPGYDQAREILGGDCHILHQTRGKIDEAGIAIASRWPIRKSREVDLQVEPRSGDAETVALVAEIDAPLPFGPILFATYPTEYRPAFELERERQAVAAARFLETLVDDELRHVIVAGDMNADPEAASMRFWTGRQSLDGTSVCYRDAWESVHAGEPGLTFTPDNPLMGAVNWDWPFRQIDHVLVRCSTHGLPALNVRACERILVEPTDGVTASDHYGILAELEVPPGPEPS